LITGVEPRLQKPTRFLWGDILAADRDKDDQNMIIRQTQQSVLGGWRPSYPDRFKANRGCQGAGSKWCGQSNAQLPRSHRSYE
jgi:hypothetical protein